MCVFAHPKCGFQNTVFMIFITYSDNVAWLEFYKFFHAHYIYMYVLPDNGDYFYLCTNKKHQKTCTRHTQQQEHVQNKLILT